MSTLFLCLVMISLSTRFSLLHTIHSTHDIHMSLLFGISLLLESVGNPALVHVLHLCVLLHAHWRDLLIVQSLHQHFIVDDIVIRSWVINFLNSSNFDISAPVAASRHGRSL